MVPFFLSLLALSLLGCADTAGECVSLAPDACATRADCFVLDGSEIAPPAVGAEESCWTVVTSASVGCGEGGSSCPAVEAFAQNPETGACWYFPMGCVPSGWGACEDGPTDGICD